MALSDEEHVQYEVDEPDVRFHSHGEYRGYSGSSDEYVENSKFENRSEEVANNALSTDNVMLNDKGQLTDEEYFNYSTDQYPAENVDDQDMNQANFTYEASTGSVEENKYSNDKLHTEDRSNEYSKDENNPNQNKTNSNKPDQASEIPEIGSGCTLYVRNLPSHLRNEDVKKYFSTFGEVIDCRIVINPVTKDSRGFGFVSFATPEIADLAMSQTDQVKLEGKVLRIEKAKRNRPHDPTPGQYKGPTGSSIKYDNRGRPRTGYAPYWDSSVSRPMHHSNSHSSSYGGPSSRHYNSSRNMNDHYSRLSPPPRRFSFYRHDNDYHHKRSPSYGGHCGSYFPVDSHASHQRNTTLHHESSRSQVPETSQSGHHPHSTGYQNESVSSMHGKSYYEEGSSGHYAGYSRSRDHNVSYYGHSRMSHYDSAHHDNHRDTYHDSRRTSPKRYPYESHIESRSSDHVIPSRDRHTSYGRSSHPNRNTHYSGYYGGSSNVPSVYERRGVSSGSTADIVNSNSYDHNKGHFSSRGHSGNFSNWYSVEGGNNVAEGGSSQGYIYRNRMHSNYCERDNLSSNRKLDDKVLPNPSNDRSSHHHSRTIRSRSPPIARSHRRSRSVTSRNNDENRYPASNQGMPALRDNYEDSAMYHMQHRGNIPGRQQPIMLSYNSEFGNSNTEKNNSQRKS